MSDRDQNRPDGDVPPSDTPGADELRKAAAARYGLSFPEDADAADVGGAEVDDDVTVAAGSAELEELRRAAAAGGVVAGFDDDVTVAADSAELEELRRAAADAADAGGAEVDDDATRLSGVVDADAADVGGAEVDDDVTVAAGSAELEELRRAAAAGGGVAASVDDEATRVIEPIEPLESPAPAGTTPQPSGGEPVDVVESSATAAAARTADPAGTPLVPPSETSSGRWAPAGMLSHSSDHYRNGDDSNVAGGNRRMLMIGSGVIAVFAVVLVGSVLLFGGGNADADPSASGGSSTTISGEPVGSAPAVPSTVSISSAIAECETTVGVTLTWDKADDGGHPFVGYEVSSALLGEAADAEAAVWSDWTSAGRTEIYTIGDLATGVLYAFKVRAVNEIGPSEPSSDVIASEPTCLAPGVPQNLTAKREDTTMNAMWDAPAEAPGRVRYLVDVEVLDDEGTGQKFGEQIRVLSTSALIENVDNELAYRIRVTACNPAGCSEPTPWKRKAPKVLKDQP